MNDTSKRVGAVDGDKLVEFLTTVTAMSHEAWQEIYDEITSGRFALKPEASQKTKWEKLKAVRKDLDGCRQIADRLSCRNDGSYDAGKCDAFETAIELIDELLENRRSK